MGTVINCPALNSEDGPWSIGPSTARHPEAGEHLSACCVGVQAEGALGAPVSEGRRRRLPESRAPEGDGPRAGGRDGGVSDPPRPLARKGRLWECPRGASLLQGLWEPQDLQDQEKHPGLAGVPHRRVPVNSLSPHAEISLFPLGHL